MALAAVLALAAVSKVRSPRSAARGLETFRVPGPFRIPAVGVIAGAELVLAAGAAAGFDAAAYTAAAMLAAFAVVLGATLAGGGRGKPCACFGARSRVSGGAVARNLVLAAAFVAAPSLPEGRPSAEGWLALGLLATVLCVGVLAVAVVALAREVGLLRLRLGTESALDIVEDGPPIGSRITLPERFDGTAPERLALAVFSSDACRLCQSLKPVVAAFARDPLVAVEIFDEVQDADVWRALNIPGSPFAVALDSDGAVRAKGTFNTYGQLESIVATAERQLADAHA
jgi:hypothetical protein